MKSLKTKRKLKYTLSFCLSGILFAAPVAAENWSQWNESTVSGLSRGYWKFAVASYYQPEIGGSDSPQAVGLGGQFESLVTDNWGVGLQAYGQNYSANAGMSAASFLLSLKYHFFDRSPVNVFAGTLAGIHYLDFTNKDGQAGESFGATAGLSVYFWGSFFSELQADYLSYGYANGTGSMNLQSVRLHISVGLMF